MIQTFLAPLTSTATILTPTRGLGVGTFSRASSQYTTDFEGETREVKSGGAAVEGGRVVTNLLTYSEDLSNAAWGKFGTCTVTGTNVINLPAENDYVSGTIAVSIPTGVVLRGSVYLSGSGTTRLRLARQGSGTYEEGLLNITLTATPTRYVIIKTFTNNQTGARLDIIRATGLTATSMTATQFQLENVTAQTNQNPGEYVATTSAVVSKCFSTTNGNTVDANGVVTEATGTALPQSYPERINSTAYALNAKIQVSGWWYNCTTAGTSAGTAPTFATGKVGLVTVADNDVVWTLGGRLLLGYVAETASTNKVTAYDIIPADTLGSELSSGVLVLGQKYQITARDTADFTADGSANNTVGTQFVATAATVTLDATNKVKRVQWGVGEKSFYSGAAFINNITNLTLSGDHAGILDIASGTTLTTNAGVLGINPTSKLYEGDNSAGSAASIITASGTAGNTNKHSGTIYIAKVSGAGTSTVEINGTTTTITSAALTRVTVPNVTTASGSSLIVNVGIGDKVQFLLPQLEELPYATSIIPTAGAAVTRAADRLYFQTAGNYRVGPMSGKVEWTPNVSAIGGTERWLWGSYTDANNATGTLYDGTNIIFRKRIGGVNYDATKALAVVAGTTYLIGYGVNGDYSTYVSVAGVKGTGKTAGGSVSLANMRLSLVNGTAFVDFSAAGTLTPYIGKTLTVRSVTDPTQYATGVIQAAGTGPEGLGDELISAWTNHASYPYETFTNSGSGITSAINSSGLGICYSAVTTVSGALYKSSFNLTLNSGVILYHRMDASNSLGDADYILRTVSPTTGVYTLYGIPPGTSYYMGFRTNSGIASDFSVSSYTLKQVLTPSATGVTIATTWGGVQNWTTNGITTQQNDAAGFTYTITDIAPDNHAPVFGTNIYQGEDGNNANYMFWGSRRNIEVYAEGGTGFNGGF